MNITEILKLYTADYPNIEQDLDSANEYLTDKRYERAGQAFRRIGRKLLQLKFFSISLEAFQQSSLAYKLGGLYRKGLETELTIFEVYKITGNAVEMASTYEKIASYYKYYLNEQITASIYYMKSAKIHEENQNYRSAFKKAYFACECLQETNAITDKKSANALACRMAMQSGYYEKAGEHALRWLELVPKDYSSDYISICVKGYTSFDRTPRKKDALIFLDEIIKANYLHGRPQFKIINYLIDAQKLHVFVNQSINEDYHNWLVAETKGEAIKQIRYLIELKSYAQNVGAEALADEFYIREQNVRKNQSWSEKRYFYFFLFQLWKITCNYGTSFKKWLITSLLIIILFGLCYMPVPFHITGHPILQAIKPSLSQNGHDTWFSPFYYSVITIATLGYGDILPSDTSGQIFSAFEVLLGYLMFGGLLTVFAKKITR